jgi:hypothetical protein
MRLGKPAEHGPRNAGHIARGRRARLEPADPHSGRLHEADGSPHLDLGFQGRARSRRQWPRHPLPARPGIGRLQLDQRHDLCPRPARGFRPLGTARQPRLVVGRCAALFQEGRGLGGRRRRISRRGRAAVDVEDRRPAGVVSEADPGGNRDRARIPRGRQPSAARRRRQYRLGSADPPRAAAPKRGAHLFACGTEAAEPAGRHQCTGPPHPARRHPCGRRRVCAGRRAGAGRRRS